MIPQAITAELIETSPQLFQSLRHYINETRSRIDRSAPASYPRGLRELTLVVDLDDAVHSGGLWGYLGDVTNDDGSFKEAEEAVQVLRRFQVPRIAAIVEESLEVWKEFLSVYLPARCRVNKKSFEEFQLSRTMRDTMESQLDPLDDEYFLTHAELSSQIGDYVRANLSEFIHPTHA